MGHVIAWSDKDAAPALMAAVCGKAFFATLRCPTATAPEVRRCTCRDSDTREVNAVNSLVACWPRLSSPGPHEQTRCSCSAIVHKTAPCPTLCFDLYSPCVAGLRVRLSLCARALHDGAGRAAGAAAAAALPLRDRGGASGRHHRPAAGGPRGVRCFIFLVFTRQGHRYTDLPVMVASLGACLTVLVQHPMHGISATSSSSLTLS